MTTKVFGQYGGRVLRPFKGEGTQFVSGAILTPEMVQHWPVPNRIALANNGNIDWFDAPNIEESEARDSGKKPTPKTEKVPLKSKRTK